MKYTALVFDFFGVISSDVAPHWFNNHFPLEAKTLKTRYFRDADSGKVSEIELLRQLSEITGISTNAISDEMDSYIKLNQELIDSIIELKKKYKIGLCSNAVSPFIRKILKGNNIESLFDSIIISSEVGLIKPDPNIFIKTLESLGITAKEAILIDDTILNIEEARKIGMAGIVYRSIDDFKQELSVLSD